jgi:hypothetical protein
MLVARHDGASLDCDLADHFAALGARSSLVRDDLAFTLGDGLVSMSAVHPEAHPGGGIAGAAQ